MTSFGARRLTVFAVITGVLSLAGCGDKVTDGVMMAGGPDAGTGSGTGDGSATGTGTGSDGGMDASGTGTGGMPACPAHQAVSDNSGVCVVAGEVLEDLTLDAEHNWLLKGGVFVGQDVGLSKNKGKPVILTLKAGTTVFGEESSFLAVTRGSKIMAEGTADKPIVMTSAKEDGMRASSDWGGLIINGLAPINTGEEAAGEGGTGFYGGSDPGDNSGVLRYVRVEFAGHAIDSQNELNGIAFQGVGWGTVVDYLQVHKNKDDGVEFFGGTVNVKHLVLTGIEDDSLDWTDGWTGKAQFVVAQQFEKAGDNGIEADNDSDNNGNTPFSNPTLSNVTLVGVPTSVDSDIGILLREGTKASLHNFVVLGFNDACLKLDHAQTVTNASDNSLTMRNSIISCATNFKEPKDSMGMPLDAANSMPTEAFFTETGAGNQVVADAKSVLKNAFDTAKPDFRPKSGSAAESGGKVPGSDSFFEAVTYVGALGTKNWLEGWTTFAKK